MKRRHIKIEWASGGFIVEEYNESYAAKSRHVFTDWDDVITHLKNMPLDTDLAVVEGIV